MKKEKIEKKRNREIRRDRLGQQITAVSMRSELCRFRNIQFSQYLVFSISGYEIGKLSQKDKKSSNALEVPPGFLAKRRVRFLIGHFMGIVTSVFLSSSS